jgi:hypothetical protein
MRRPVGERLLGRHDGHLRQPRHAPQAGRRDVLLGAELAYARGQPPPLGRRRVGPDRASPLGERSEEGVDADPDGRDHAHAGDGEALHQRTFLRSGRSSAGVTK